MAYNNGNFGYNNNLNNYNNNNNFGYNNSGNIGYNSYPSLPGRMVNNFNEITPQEIPMDTTPAVFVKNDMQEIQVKKWDNNGNIVPYIYRLVETNQQGLPVSQRTEFETDLINSINNISDLLSNIFNYTNNNNNFSEEGIKKIE